LPARLVAEESYKNKAALFGATEAKPAKHMSDFVWHVEVRDAENGSAHGVS
jgi:hypothetical protein